MIGVLTIIGTRPEAIKLAPILHELRRRSDVFRSRVCVTAQHRELLDSMLELFEIVPDYDLDVMRAEQSPTDVTVAVLGGIRAVLEAERPDWVIVQGDTTTTMAGGLGAFHHGARVAHVEAGLRTFDSTDPWPEEMNRRVAGVLADVHFAPTQASAENLYREGIPRQNVYVTGNTIVDAFRTVAALPFDPARTPLAGIAADECAVVVATVHRREKSREELDSISGALLEIAQDHPDVRIVCPVHPNGALAASLTPLASGVENVVLLPSLDYRQMVWLLQRAHFVITDSGGLQEEATEVGIPVLVVRKATERPEASAAGTAVVVGANREAIVSWADRLLREPDTYRQMARPIRSYGDGNAARAIIDVLFEHSCHRPGDR
jgi:UDP-N-acetylglucosamine 2-epimerase (non-hydrolysing)